MLKISSFRHAVDGIKYCFLTQHNLKFQVVAALIAVTLAFYLCLSATEIMILILVIAAVLAAEIFNTAIETVVNLVSPDYHPLAKVAKDAAAGAVLVVSVASLIIGYMLFFHRLFV